jgi:hypothetical protein
MTEKDKSSAEELTERQRKTIPFLVASPTMEEGRRKAKLSKNALYEWLKTPVFRQELSAQRELVITEALDALKGHMTKATETLVGLLNADSDSLKRYVANDIINHVLKAKELQDLEGRLEKLERIVLQRKGYR